MSDPRRDIDLTALSERLRARNPGLTDIRAEAPTKPGAGMRVVVETTRDELQRIGGKLDLNDPELAGMQIETTLRFLDHKPGDRTHVQIRKTDT